MPQDRQSDLPRSHDPDAAIVLPADLSETVAIALAEDIGSGDLTAALVPLQVATGAPP